MNEKLTLLTCPECRGPLTELGSEGLKQWRCRVGHTYSPRSFLSAHTETVERTLWSAVVALEEGAEISHEMRSFMPDAAAHLDEEERAKREAARILREIISRLGEVSAGWLSETPVA